MENFTLHGARGEGQIWASGHVKRIVADCFGCPFLGYENNWKIYSLL